jgi:hypothetical protein
VKGYPNSFSSLYLSAEPDIFCYDVVSVINIGDHVLSRTNLPWEGNLECPFAFLVLFARLILLKPLRGLRGVVSFHRLTFRNLVILIYCTIYWGPSTFEIEIHQIYLFISGLCCVVSEYPSVGNSESM